MAHCMKLRHPFATASGASAVIDHIWNLSHGVGTPNHERNQPTDVELLQRLVLLMDHGGDNFLSSATWSRIKPTGHLDHASTEALHELDSCQDLKHGKRWRVSPARYGLADYRQKDGKPIGRTEYYIVMLQRLIVQQGHADAITALPEACSPALRRELTLEGSAA